MRALALIVVPGILAQPVQAEPSGVEMWMQAQSSLPLRFESVGPYAIPSGAIVAVDPLTYSPSPEWPQIAVPKGEAEVMVALDPETGRVSKALMVFSDAGVACGHDETSIPVDTGLAALLDLGSAAALAQEATALGPDANLYTDWFAAQIDDKPVVHDMVRLPSGHRFPMTSTGWGDGIYPVASLRDAQGTLIAVYADFMGQDAEGTWLLPQECGA